jgi:hypothetical protein
MNTRLRDEGNKNLTGGANEEINGGGNERTDLRGTNYELT